MIDWMMRLALGKVKDVRRRKNYITTLLVILATGFLQTDFQSVDFVIHASGGARSSDSAGTR